MFFYYVCQVFVEVWNFKVFGYVMYECNWVDGCFSLFKQVMNEIWFIYVVVEEIVLKFWVVLFFGEIDCFVNIFEVVDDQV